MSEKKLRKFPTRNASILLTGLFVGISILGYGYLNYRYKTRALEEKIAQDKIKAEQEASLMTQKQEQEKRDYSSKRRAECYAIEQSERETFNNVISSLYQETNDTCYIHYKTHDYDNYTDEDCEREFGKANPYELDCKLRQFSKTF